MCELAYDLEEGRHLDEVRLAIKMAFVFVPLAAQLASKQNIKGFIIASILESVTVTIH